MANRTNTVQRSDMKPCKIREDHSGRRFGKVVVLSYIGHWNRGAYWECRCDCGTVKPIRIDSLRVGTNKTCGECPKAHGGESHAWKGCGELGKDIWNSYRHAADAKGFEFSISIEYAWDLFLSQGKRCAFTGWPLRFNETNKSKSERTASLDRIDSTIGYVEGNVQWVHRQVNKLKKNVSDEMFVAMCVAVANHAGKSFIPDEKEPWQDVRSSEGGSYLSK